jgi:hypothetical protein
LQRLPLICELCEIVIWLLVLIAAALGPGVRNRIFDEFLGTSVATPFLDVQVDLPLILIVLALCFWMGHLQTMQLQKKPIFSISRDDGGGFVVWLGIEPDDSSEPFCLHGRRFRRFAVLLSANHVCESCCFNMPISDRKFFKKCESLGQRNSWPREAMVLGISLGISFSGLVTKLTHANTARFQDSYADLVRLAKLHGLSVMPDAEKFWAPAFGRQSRNLGMLPGTFYGHSQYTVLEGFSLDKPAGVEEEARISFCRKAGRSSAASRQSSWRFKNRRFS